MSAERQGPVAYDRKLSEVWVCPKCGATSRERRWWSAAGRCHLGDDAVEPERFVPAGHSAVTDDMIERGTRAIENTYRVNGIRVNRHVVENCLRAALEVPDGA